MKYYERRKGVLKLPTTTGRYKRSSSSSSCNLPCRQYRTKKDIKEYIAKTFRYDLEQTIEEIRPHYYFDETCQGSVPQAIIAFLESEDYEDAVRKAVSLGGDSDTIACITGGIAEAFFHKIPAYIVQETVDDLIKGCYR